MKLLVTGKTGQLGHDICKELEARGHEVIGMGSADMDITDADAVRKVLYANRPEIVIHCAAYTAVDNAEDEVETCRRVNVDGTENIARICRELDAVMLYLSTDYVFSGRVSDHGSRKTRQSRLECTALRNMRGSWQ